MTKLTFCDTAKFFVKITNKETDNEALDVKESQFSHLIRTVELSTKRERKPQLVLLPLLKNNNFIVILKNCSSSIC